MKTTTEMFYYVDAVKNGEIVKTYIPKHNGVPLIDRKEIRHWIINNLDLSLQYAIRGHKVPPQYPNAN